MPCYAMPCNARTVGCIVDPFAAAGPCPDKLIAAIAIGKLPKGVASSLTDRRTDRQTVIRADS